MAGELVYSFDNDNITEYQYDMAGRLMHTVSKNAARDESIQTHYYHDELGQLQQVIQLTDRYHVGIKYQRDAAGRVVQEQQTVATHAGEILWEHPVNHQYSAHGVRIQTQIDTLPAVNWLTYGSGHLLGASMMGNELIEFTRDRLHRECHRRFGKLQQTATYDPLGRLTQLFQQPISGLPQHRLYRYDSLNQLIEIQHDKTPFQQFGYDSHGRLNYFKEGTEETHYRFDAAGNREMLPSSANFNEWNKEISLRGVQNNRLSQDKDYHYVYDNFGNRIQRLCAPFNKGHFTNEQPISNGNRHEYRYDAQQRLVAFWDHNDGRNKCVEYLYDAFGRRVAKINPNKDPQQDANMIFYGWDGDKLVTTHYNQEKIYTLYEANSFVPLLRLTQPLNAENKSFPKTIHAYYCDHRGAPTALLTIKGTLDWQAKYDVWGARLNYTKPDTLYQPIRLQGQHYDIESGLYYNRNRFYDPKIGRYISQDPIGLKGGSNLYKYPFNPNQAVDPLGLNPMALINSGKGIIDDIVNGLPIFDGIGDTSACSYYDSMIKSVPSCSYYEEAAKICRGENKAVNALIDYNIMVSSNASNKLKQSEVLTSIRNSLVKSDAEARSAGKIDKNGCTWGNEIDAYHEEAFKDAGVSPWLYGGNLWPQGVKPNPVPFDPSSIFYDW